MIHGCVRMNTLNKEGKSNEVLHPQQAMHLLSEARTLMLRARWKCEPTLCLHETGACALMQRSAWYSWCPSGLGGRPLVLTHLDRSCKVSLTAERLVCSAMCIGANLRARNNPALGRTQVRSALAPCAGSCLKASTRKSGFVKSEKTFECPCPATKMCSFDCCSRTGIVPVLPAPIRQTI